MSLNRTLAVIGLLVWMCAAPASWAANRCASGGAPRPDDSGVGGTGLSASPPDDDDSGVGGTGKRPAGPDDDDDSGVGGTGASAQADTGVIGTITGFASICVGEVEITYEPSSLVKIDGVAASPADLAVGQVVEVVARGRGNELGAREIAVQHIVGGPITRVSSDGSDIDVIGQRVRLTPATRGDDPIARVGEFVRVSGMREADGTIVASRVTAGGDEVARLAGPVDGVGPGMIAVAGTPVVVPERLELSAGDEVRVAGSWDGDRLVASSVEPVPRLPFGGRVARVDVEGYARVSAAGELRVGPYRFAGSSDAAAGISDLDPHVPVRVELSVRDGRAVIERIDSVPNLPPRPDARDGRGPGHWDGGDRSARDGFNQDLDARPPREGRGGMPDGARGPGDVGSGPPDRPARPVDVRPPIDARPPERPLHAGPPPIDRPELPSRPDRPPRPGRP